MPLHVRQPSKHYRHWEIFDWPLEQQKSIYKSWSIFYSTNGNFDAAAKYIGKCMEKDPYDYKILYQKSSNQRYNGDALGAVEWSTRASLLSSKSNPQTLLELCDAYYELNEFETNKRLLHEKKSNFSGNAQRQFDKRINLVDSNYTDMLGESLTPFFHRNGEKFNEALKASTKSVVTDNRPLWKIMKEQDKCDVLSILEEQKVALSPLALIRRERKSNILYNNYLRRAWKDFSFLQKLLKDEYLYLPRCTAVSESLASIIKEGYIKAKVLVKMLQSRSPMYNEVYLKRRNEKLNWQMKNENLYRIQNQTRRNMHSILRKVRALRAGGNVERLRIFVEEIMGNYVTLKTNRVMPWKFEFINEVYNSLALALAEQYTLPNFRISPHDSTALCKVLKLKVDKHQERIEFVFGKRSTYEETDLKPKILYYKKLIAHLENRMLFAKYPIERSYLFHEIANAHLKCGHFDECNSNARKSIEEAKRANSVIWMFLSTMLKCKSHAIMNKYGNQQKVLESAYNLAKTLKSPKLCTFVELCRMLNNDYLELKKQTMSDRRFKTKASLAIR